MFNNSSGTKDFQAKQEGETNHEPMLPKYISSSRQWAGFKNPRIIRVAKGFGGKDRHSKVCTVKGLRDRRIRLSVPTAIQLYDLQDRLGLSQPSKVIDWLLESTKDDIDQLPPLPMLHGDHNKLYPDLSFPQFSFSQFLRASNETFVKVHDNNDHEIYEDHQRKKGKEVQLVGDGNGGLNFFPIPQYSYPGLFPYNPYNPNFEPCSNLSISQFGNNQGLVSSQTSSMAPLPSASQLLLGPPPAITPSANFPPFIMPNLGEHHDLVRRQNNYFHLLNSSSQHAPPNPVMPLFNPSDSQVKLPFGNLDAHLKVCSQNNDDR